MVFEKTKRKRRNQEQRRALRCQLSEAQNWRCAYCGCSLEYETATMDHVAPLTRGGVDAWENMVASCASCNNAKDRTTPPEITADWRSGEMPVFNALPLLG